jgi:hypothetical protein
VTILFVATNLENMFRESENTRETLRVEGGLSWKRPALIIANACPSPVREANLSSSIHPLRPLCRPPRWWDS